jgi:hypothetical protein
MHFVPPKRRDEGERLLIQNPRTSGGRADPTGAQRGGVAAGRAPSRQNNDEWFPYPIRSKLRAIVLTGTGIDPGY